MIVSHFIIQICLTLYILDCLPEFAVRRLFIFLKKTVNFEYFQEDFIQINLLSEKELKEYVLTDHRYLRSEKFLKLMIKKRRCKEFVAFMLELPDYHHHHRHITEEIRKSMRYETHKASKSNFINVVFFCFLFVSESLLCCFFFTIVVSMFQVLKSKSLPFQSRMNCYENIFICYTMFLNLVTLLMKCFKQVKSLLMTTMI